MLEKIKKYTLLIPGQELVLGIYHPSEKCERLTRYSYIGIIQKHPRKLLIGGIFLNPGEHKKFHHDEAFFDALLDNIQSLLDRHLQGEPVTDEMIASVLPQREEYDWKNLISINTYKFFLGHREFAQDHTRISELVQAKVDNVYAELNARYPMASAYQFVSGLHRVDPHDHLEEITATLTQLSEDARSSDLVEANRDHEWLSLSLEKSIRHCQKAIAAIENNASSGIPKSSLDCTLHLTAFLDKYKREAVYRFLAKVNFFNHLSPNRILYRPLSELPDNRRDPESMLFLAYLGMPESSVALLADVIQKQVSANYPQGDSCHVDGCLPEARSSIIISHLMQVPPRHQRKAIMLLSKHYKSMTAVNLASREAELFEHLSTTPHDLSHATAIYTRYLTKGQTSNSRVISASMAQAALANLEHKCDLRHGDSPQPGRDTQGYRLGDGTLIDDKKLILRGSGPTFGNFAIEVLPFIDNDKTLCIEHIGAYQRAYHNSIVHNFHMENIKRWVLGERDTQGRKATLKTATSWMRAITEVIHKGGDKDDLMPFYRSGFHFDSWDMRITLLKAFIMSCVNDNSLNITLSSLSQIMTRCQRGLTKHYSDDVVLKEAAQAFQRRSISQQGYTTKNCFYQKHLVWAHDAHQFMREARSKFPVKLEISWAPSTDTILLGRKEGEEYYAIPLHSYESIKEEANALGHCIESYFTKAMTGEYYIWSIQKKDRQGNYSHVSTLGMEAEPEVFMVIFDQHLGFENTRPPEKICHWVQQFANMIDTSAQKSRDKEHSIFAFTCYDQESIPPEDIPKIGTSLDYGHPDFSPFVGRKLAKLIGKERLHRALHTLGKSAEQDEDETKKRLGQIIQQEADKHFA